MNKKICWLFSIIAVVFLSLTISCSKDEPDNPYDPEYNQGTLTVNTTSITFPSTGGTKNVILSNGYGATYSCGENWIKVYRNSSETYQISADNNTGSSRQTYVLFSKGSDFAKITVKQDGSNGTGTGTGEQPGTGGGSGSATKVPSAPTGLNASPNGTSTAPYAALTWNQSTGATSYIVYRSNSANSSYSQISTTNTFSYLDKTVKYGNTYYYKIKAKNSAGSSDFSSYAVCEFKDKRKPGPVTYGNCTVSGTSMTLRWKIPTDASYGKATKAILKVMNPISGIYADLQTLSGTATSVTFTYAPWVDKDGFIRAGIILENENGSGGGTPKIYDNKNKKWIN